MTKFVSNVKMDSITHRLNSMINSHYKSGLFANWDGEQP